jgi:large subunit ribosomal protein L21
VTYAIITVGGKQHRVREGEWLLVDRVPYEEGATFQPDVLLVGGDGEALLGADELKGQTVTVRVTGHLLGEKVIIGKHKRRTGYRRRNGFRPRLSRIEVEAIGASKPARSRAKKTTEASAEPAEAPVAAERAKPARAKAEPAKPAAAKAESAEAAPKRRRKPAAEKE